MRYRGVSILDINVRTLVYIDVSGPDICVLDVSAQKKVNASVPDTGVGKLVYIEVSAQKKVSVTERHIKTI